MDMQRLDLNLLKVFDAVYRLRNLSEVAQHVSLSQSAVSHALNRLRTSVGDKLFVRTASGLEPTARSEQLIVPVQQALLLIGDSLFASSDFEPQECEREFRLLLSDVGELVFVPRLLQRLREEAPRASLVVAQGSRTHYDAMLRNREADVALGSLPGLSASLKQRLLFQDTYVVIKARSANRRRASITLAEYAAAAHAVVVPPGSPPSVVDVALRRLKIERRVVLRLPHFFAVPSVVLSTDVMVTVPSSVARNLRSADGLHISKVPFETPPMEVKAFWHVRQDRDPAHRWLRGLLTSSFGG